MLLEELVAAGGHPSHGAEPASCNMETIKLTRRAVEHGCGGVLMLPPFCTRMWAKKSCLTLEVVQRVRSYAAQNLCPRPRLAGWLATPRLVERLLPPPAEMRIAGIDEAWAIETVPETFSSIPADLIERLSLGARLLLLAGMRSGREYSFPEHNMVPTHPASDGTWITHNNNQTEHWWVRPSSMTPLR